jgi:hypothetical protein
MRTTTESVVTKLNGAGLSELDAARAAKLEQEVDLAEALLIPNPESLNTTAEQLSIPVVSKTSPLEFFRTHPTLRLTLRMLTPNKGELGAFTYAVMPAAEALLARHHFEPYAATLFPIVIDSRPMTYKLMTVKLPPPGREWDNYNLSRKVALDIAVDRWIAMRSVRGGYEGCDPDPAAEFPEPVFPDWTAHEWLRRSLGVADLIIGGEDHHVFKAIKHI